MSSNLDESVIKTLRDELLAARQSVVSGLGVAEADLAAMLEVAEPELEERSQEEAASDVATRVSGLRFDELRAIQGALARIANGTYGVCVHCGSGIALERLRAVPSTPTCADCANAATPDVGGPAREQAASASLPEELVGLSDAEIAALVRETLRDEVGEAIGSLRVLCRHGVIGLDGEVASDELREVVLRVIEEEIGLETLDRMRDSRFAREPARAGGEGRGMAPVREAGAAGSDQFEAAEEGTDYVAPDTPPPRPRR